MRKSVFTARPALFFESMQRSKVAVYDQFEYVVSLLSPSMGRYSWRWIALLQKVRLMIVHTQDRSDIFLISRTTSILSDKLLENIGLRRSIDHAVEIGRKRL